MSTEPRRRMTVEEYLAFERASETKHEYVDGEVYPWGESPRVITPDADRARENHRLIAGNVFASCSNQLRGRGCRVYPSDLRVQLGDPDHYAYPDLAIVCGPPQFADDGHDTLLNPTVLIAILAPAMELGDRTRKFRRHQRIPSFREYVLIAQDEPRVEHFVRRDDGQWLYEAAEGLAATLALPAAGCTLALADVYEGVVFDAIAE